MENARLNKELAEWVGLNPVLCWGYREVDGRFVASPPEFGKAEFDGFDTDDTEQRWCFWHPQYRHYEELPNLLHSIDAIFEWIVPKVISLDGFSLLSYQYIGFAREIKLLRHSWSIHFDDEKDNSYASAETSALALCQAVQQLIDRISQPPSGDARNLAE